MKNNDTIIVEETFNVSASEVWNAITNIDEMKHWYFENIPDFKPTPGFETEFSVKSESRNFLHKWKITKVITDKLIEYNWQYEEYPGKATVIFELFDEGTSTRLKLTNKVVENFPEEIPEFSAESCQAGWDYFIKGNLKKYLENK
ncbi:MAG: SRPBCC domain-containing protein [Melioribacteraceae bacterium]|nr:SRPBCC domain-containing protein [Melioribacteraceae bacterium]